MSKHTVKAELLPSPAAIVRAKSGVDEIALKELVDRRVAEIMAERDALVFEPFFRSRQVAYELKRLQTVPEQRKFSISYERYGCIDCKTTSRPHAGNSMCHKCRYKWFARWAQIIAEGVNDVPAVPSLGTPGPEQRIPSNQPTGVHRTWKRRSSEQERLVYRRVAKRLNVSPAWVRRVASGSHHSRFISEALLKESKEFAVALKNGLNDEDAVKWANRLVRESRSEEQ